jgi:hypothetical protein
VHLLDRLNRKLAESFSQPWGTRGKLRPEIVAPIEDTSTGSISGTLRFYVLMRSGEEALVFDHPFGPLENEEEVDNCLADALSKLLSMHASWPR